MSHLVLTNSGLSSNISLNNISGITIRQLLIKLVPKIEYFDELAARQKDNRFSRLGYSIKIFLLRLKILSEIA